MSYKFEWIGDDILVQFFDELNFDQVQEVNNIIYGDIRFDRMRYQIFDFSNILILGITIDEMKIISTLDKSSSIWNNSIKVACITINVHLKQLLHEYTFGMKGTNWSCMIFENLDEAKEWCSK